MGFQLFKFYVYQKMAGLSAGFFQDPEGPIGPLTKNSASQGANKASIDLEQKQCKKIVRHGVPTKLQLTLSKNSVKKQCVTGCQRSSNSQMLNCFWSAVSAACAWRPNDREVVVSIYRDVGTLWLELNQYVSPSTTSCSLPML